MGVGGIDYESSGGNEIFLAYEDTNESICVVDEIVIDDLHVKIDEILENQKNIINEIKKIEEKLDINPDTTPKISSKK